MVETSDYSDSCSFYSESWGEESELSSELAARPASPGTAVQQQPSDLNIAGFRATWLVGSWANRARRRRRADDKMTCSEEDEAATFIQAISQNNEKLTALKSLKSESILTVVSNRPATGGCARARRSAASPFRRSQGSAPRPLSGPG